MLSLKTAYKPSKVYLAATTKELFEVSFLVYLLLLFAEVLQTGFVSYFFNLNILLGIVFLSGILMIFTAKKHIE